ncbi:S41 family peptidase [Pseudofulvibacter geojedonensis]|uniref:S41 family peptidase n=1 Tax=Pseudofulvibacter geojedonensis TaxID=1123758 RepID=A0ABW3I4D9_9FLAO
MKSLLKKRVLIPVLAIGIFISTSAFKNDFFEIAKQIEIFTTLFKELNMNYVDETNPGDLMDTAIKSMLNDLDPYTKFHNEQDVESYKINNSGEYTGIGAGINRKNGRLFVTEPFKDYPADKAGLKAGDEIIQVDNIKVSDFKEDTGTLLKGAPNSTVEITYLRQGKEHKTTLTRSAIDIDAVPFSKKINENTGYIVLKKFNSKAFAQTKKAVVDLKTEGATQLILDLRGNPGGLLRESIRIVNLFVPKGEVIVTTKSKVKKYNKVYTTKDDPLDTEIPLVVLVNGSSASASEIVSGALQDLDRAVVIGSRSFGKGLVQRPKKLTYGTQLKVTISRYYTPSGRCIQALDYWNRDEKGNAVKTKEKDYNAFKTKNGRTVYDGGGVDPDIKIDNESLSNISKALIQEQILFNFCTDFYYKNSFNDLSSFTFTDKDYESFKQFVINSDFNYKTKTEKLLERLKSQTEKDEIGVEQDIKNLETAIVNAKNNALNTHKEELKSLLADQLVMRYFYREGLYHYHIQNHEAIQKAIAIMNSKEYQNILK